MDDKAPADAHKGDMPAVEPRVTPQSWSCVDYVYSPRKDGMEANQPSYAAKPTSDGLRVRFGAVTESVTPRGDGDGKCVKYVGGKLLEGKCGTAMTIDGLGSGTSASAEQWWEGKRTNAGWPGTESGNTKTADGMADDLSKALDRGQRNKVAGLLSKTISGAEVKKGCIRCC